MIACAQASPETGMSEPGLTTAPAADSAKSGPIRRKRMSEMPRRRRSAFAMLVLVAVWPRLAPEEDSFRIDLAAVGPTGGAKPQVLNPRLQGMDSEKRPFQITADLGSRTKTDTGSETYDLTNPKAEIVLTDGSWIALNADNGLFESDANILHLSGNVNLFHDEGYEFQTAAARVNLETSTASGDEPIDGQGPFGILQASGFRVLDSGERILFIGPAKMTVFEGAPPQ